MSADQLDRRVRETVHVARPDIATVVHDHVDLTERVECARGRGFERRMVEQIGGQHERGATGRGDDRRG